MQPDARGSADIIYTYSTHTTALWLTTSQIRSCTKYLIPSDNFIVPLSSWHFSVEKTNPINIIYWEFDSGLLHGPPYVSAAVPTRWPKKVSHYQIIKKVLNRKSLPMRFDFFIILKKWSNTIILYVCIKYSLHDLLFDVNNMTYLQYSNMHHIQ